MVLVTGATGFIGRALVQTLIDRKFVVQAAVRQASGFSREFVVGDLGSETDWAAALRGCQTVVHLAARVHVMRDTATDPLSEFRTANVDGTRKLAQQAADAGVRRFVFLSSIKVNGEQTITGQPFTADDLPAPQDAYGQSKLEAEVELRRICSGSAMEFVIIRPPLVYGPGVGGNFRALLNLVQRGIPLPLRSVKNRRSLIALDNLTDLIATCLLHPAAANQVLMAADAESFSTPELLFKIGRAYNCAPRLLPFPPSWMRRCASMVGQSSVVERLLGSLEIDASKTCDVLGWAPIVSIDEQLRRMAKDDSRS